MPENYAFTDGAVIQSGDKLVIFTNDDLTREEVEYLQAKVMEHVPQAEVIVVVGITGVVISRVEAEEEAL